MRKKKALAGVLASALVLGSLTLPENISFGDLNFGTLFAQAAEVVDSGTCGANLTWTLDDEGTLTISGTGEMKTAPWDLSSVVSVIIEDGVTSICDSAFYYGSSLESVTLPETLTTIGAYAFESSHVKSINIPDSLTTVGDRAFYACSGLADEDGFVIIKNTLYYYTGSDTEITIPDGVTSIGAYALRNKSITEVTLPNSITAIGDYAFYYCTSLASIKLSDNLTYIGNYAFYDCKSLTNIDIPDSVTYVGDMAFRYCEGLADKDGFVIVNNVLYDYFGDDTEIKIPDGITTISEDTFNSYTSITSVEIPDSVTYIGAYAFNFCFNLTDVYYSSDAEDWYSIEISKFGNGCLTSANIHFTEKTYDLGDVNEDGTINYLDAMQVLRYDAELIELTDEQLVAGDVNGDGSVNSLDAILILRYDARLIEEF